MIRFLDLNRLNSRYEAEFHEVLGRMLENESFVLGNLTGEFERQWAMFTGVDYAIGVASGYDALYLILEAYKILGKLQAGDEIIIPANTYIATILPVIKSGLKPVLTEPGEDLNLTVEGVREKFSSKTRAVLPVHLYGKSVDLQPILDFARSEGLLVIDDAAQAHGAEYESRRIGSLTDATAWSFYPTKNLGALGDGGMVTTNDPELDKTIRILRNYGQQEKYNSVFAGINSRLDALQAGFLSVKLKDLLRLNDLRKAVVRQYDENIQNPKIRKPPFVSCLSHVYHQYVIFCEERDRLQRFLYENGVETIVHYPVPPYRQAALEGIVEEDFPVSDRISREILSLPIDPFLKEEEIYQIINLINDFE